MLQKNLRKVKEEIKKKLPYLITLSYGLSIRYVYADGKSDPLASLKKLGPLVVSLVVVYGIVQAELGVAEAGRGMGNHDSSQMSSVLSSSSALCTSTFVTSTFTFLPSGYVSFLTQQLIYGSTSFSSSTKRDTSA